MGRSIGVRRTVAARRIRWGVLCLPLAGLVSLGSFVVSDETILPSEDLRGFAEQATSARFQSSLMIGHLLRAPGPSARIGGDDTNDQTSPHPCEPPDSAPCNAFDTRAT